MKHIFIDWFQRREEVLIAQFGQARLVKKLNGRMELQGGSLEDRTAAKESISLFMHEAVPQRQ